MTEAQKKYFKRIGQREEDLPQLDEALKRTKYMISTAKGKKKISKKEAIALLGEEKYLSGISRSAFHRDAARETDDGRTVYFEAPLSWWR